MQSFGLALTLSLLTVTFVALDLTDVQTGSTKRTISHASSPSDGISTLAIMPSNLPGIAIPKADIRNRVFALGSSTDREGLHDHGHHASHQEYDADESTDSPESATTRADKANDFVLI